MWQTLAGFGRVHENTCAIRVLGTLVIGRRWVRLGGEGLRSLETSGFGGTRCRSATLGAMGSADLPGLDVSRVHLACRRIAGLAHAIAEAHRFGRPQGPHARPWTAEYHRDAVKVYSKSLPWSYQENIATLFGQSADTMDGLSIPAVLAEDWAIITEYLRGASFAIDRWLSSEESGLLESETVFSSDIEDHTPVVVHFDELADLTTSEGANRLERAALAVRSHMETLSQARLGEHEQRLLEMVASGMTIGEIAVELNYSPRSLQRELGKLWRALGVHDRTEGLHKAVEEGLVDRVRPQRRGFSGPRR